MKTLSTLKHLALLAVFASGLTVHAQTTYTWTNLLGGSWATAANWNPNLAASGSGNTADFSTLTLGASRAVTLDGAKTIGNMIFGDVGNAYGWTLSTGSAGPLTLAVSSGAPTITVNNKTNTISLVLAGSSGMTKAGAGNLVLSGGNTYTGTTTVNSGILTLSYNNSGQGTIESAILTILNGTTVITTVNNPVGYNGTVNTINIFGGTYTTIATGDQCWEDTFNLMGGTISGAGDLAVDNAANSVFNTIATNVTSTISEKINTRSSSGLIPFNVAAGTASPDLLVSGVINNTTGGQGIAKNGAGVMSLTAANTFSGFTFVNAGKLQLSTGGSAGCMTNSAITIAPGAELDCNAGDALGYAVNLAITNAGTIKKIYAQSETLNRIMILTNGTITSTAYGGSTEAYNFFGNYIRTLAGTTNLITGVGNFGLRTSSCYFTNEPNSTLTIACVVQGYGNAGTTPFNKMGSGRLKLTAANTYAGSTVINGGTLEVDGSIGNGVVTVNSNATFEVDGSTGSGAVTVSSGATLDGVGKLYGATTVQSGGTLMAGTNAVTGTLSISNSLTLNAGSTNFMRINKTGGTPASDTVQVLTSVAYSGTLTVTNITSDASQLAAGDTFYLFNASSYSGGFTGYNLPALATGLSWNTSQLLVNGTITVISGSTPPTFTPPGGGYIGSVSVTISSDAGTTIYYTTDGSNPTTSGTVISGASPINNIIIPVSTTETLTAYATNTTTHANASPVVSATYTTVPTGIWTNTAGGSWPVTANWNVGAVPNGSGITADFSQMTLTGAVAVAASSGQVIGQMLFEDAGNTYGWTLTGGPITLNAGVTVPSIVVSNQGVNISATLISSNGLVISGVGGTPAPGVILSSLNNNFTNLTLSGVSVTNTTAAAGTSTTFDLGAKVAASTITVNSNAVLNFTLNNIFGGGGMTNTTLPTLVVNGLVYSTRYNAMPNIVLNGGTLDQSPSDTGTYNGYQFLGSVTVGGTSASLIKSENNKYDHLLGTGTTFNVAVTGVAGPDLTVSCGLTNASGDYGNSAGILIKTGAGTMALTGVNAYTGSTIVSNGTLEVDGSTGNGAVAVNGGILDGTGTVGGPVTVNSGGTLAAGTAAGMGTLTIGNTLHLAGTNFMRISKTGGSTTCDLVEMTILTYGGTLVVTNITSDANLLAAGDSFQIFSANSSYSGVFTTLNLPPLPAGLFWDTSGLTSSGRIAVTANAPTPVFSPTAGGFVGTVTVTISSEAGAEIYYTIDGSDPMAFGPTVMSNASPVTVAIPANTASETITAFASVPAGNSGDASATYSTINIPTWITTSGNWSSPGNWMNNVVGNGINETADFSTVNLGGNDAMVTLDIAPTIGNLIFADQNNANNWIIADGGVGPLTLAASSGSSTITVSNQTTTLTAQLTGTNGLVKAGAGTLVLSNICTYTGNTVVNGGNLILATNNTGMGTIGGTLTVNPGATATATAQNALGYTNGTVLRTLQVTTLNLYGGTFNNASTGDNGWDLTVNMMGGTLAATGTGAHLAAGSGTVINTLATNVSSVISGIINTRENNPSNQIPFNVAAGTVPSGGPDLLVSGNINAQTAGVGITKNGPGVMALAATNGFSGATVVSNGVLQLLAGGGSVGTLANSAVTVFSPGELQLFTGDALGFTYSAARTLTLMGATLREINTNSETLARPTILSNATITAISGAGLTASQAIIAQGTQGDCFNLYGATAIITTSPGTTNYISLLAGNNFALRGGSFTNGAGSYLIVNGVLNGWGGSSSYALTKTGAGTMILNSNNTYTGVTTVSNGTLEVDGSIAGGAVTVGSGALLDGTGTINGSPTIQSGGTLMAGTLASIGTLSISNVLTLTSGGTTQMRISKTGGTLASDLLQGMISVTYGSTLTVSNVTSDGNQFIPGDVLKLFNSSSYSGTFASIQGLPALTNAFWSWDTSQLNINGTIQVITGAGTPTFNPPGGNYVGAQSVTISSDAGSTIFYTTDGSIPTTSSTHGASPITGIIVPVGTTEIINAYATNSGTTPSLLASETYVTVPTAIWTNTAGGSWPVGANWNLGVVGSGSGITADFSTLTLTANTTVTLNVPETIGSMLFEDHGSTYGWTLAGTGPLTMDAGITVPSIVVSNLSATISTPLAGTNGLVKAGSGLMNLTTPTTYSGATVVSNGVLKLSSGGGAVGTLANSPITVEPGAELQVFAGDALGYTYVAGKTLTLNGGTLREINTNSETLGRPITMNNGTITANPGAGNTGATVLGDCYNLFNATAILSTAPNSTNYISLPVGCNFAIRGGSFSNAANSVLVVNGVVDGWGGSSAYALIKDGTGSLILNSNNTYAGSTVVSNGTLEVDGSIAAGGVAVNGGTLDGTGGINGPVTVNGGTLSAGTAAGIGTLAISNTLQLVSGTVAMRISKNGGVLTNDNVQGLSGALYGGTLTVTNVTSDATALAAGDKFTLFTSSGYLYSFSTTNLPALPSGLAWVTTNLTVDGSIAVVASVSVNTTPTNITATVSGNVLSLSWPVDHTGWRLLVQTNNLASGISSNTNDWTTVYGSAGINQTNIVINPTQPAEFYRLVYP